MGKRVGVCRVTSVGRISSGVSMRAALWTCALVALPAVVRAQTPIANEPGANEPAAGTPAGRETYYTYRAGDRVFGFWAGASLSPSAVFGRIADRRLLLAGVRMEQVLESRGSVTTTYTLDGHP